MHTEWTQVANLALARVSEKVIVSINDNNELAGRIRSILVPVAKQVLEVHDWNSASQRTRLSKLAAAPIGGGSAQYALPQGFIRAIEVFRASNGGQGSTEEWIYSMAGRDDWRAENGVLIMGDKSGWGISDAVIGLRYIRYTETDIAKWSELLKDAIACKLAVRLATNVKGSSPLAQSLMQEFKMILREAQHADVYREGNKYHVTNTKDQGERVDKDDTWGGVGGTEAFADLDNIAEQGLP